MSQRMPRSSGLGIWKDTSHVRSAFSLNIALARALASCVLSTSSVHVLAYSITSLPTVRRRNYIFCLINSFRSYSRWRVQTFFDSHRASDGTIWIAGSMVSLLNIRWRVGVEIDHGSIAAHVYLPVVWKTSSWLSIIMGLTCFSRLVFLDSSLACWWLPVISLLHHSCGCRIRS